MKKHIFLALIISFLSSFAYAAMPRGIANEGGSCGLGASLQALFCNQALAARPAGAGASALFAAIRDRRERQVNALAAAIGHQGQNAIAFTYLLLQALVPGQVVTFAIQNNRLYQAPFIIDAQHDIAVNGRVLDLGATGLNISVLVIALPQLGLLALAPVQPNEALTRAQFDAIQPRAIQQIWQQITGVAGAAATMNAVVASDAGHGHYVSYVQGAAGQIIRCDDATIGAAAATFADSLYGNALVPRIMFYQMPVGAASVKPVAAGAVAAAGAAGGFDEAQLNAAIAASLQVSDGAAAAGVADDADLADALQASLREAEQARQRREQEELERAMAASRREAEARQRRAAAAAAEARRRAQEDADMQRALAASRAEAERQQGSHWSCPLCTFSNAADLPACEMCQIRRLSK